MTYVIVSSQVIDRKIRLEVQRYHVIDAFSLKCCFIGVDIIGILPAYLTHVKVQCRRMKHIIMVQQTDVISLCHPETLICIAGYTFILFQFPVADPRIFFLIFKTYFFNIAVRCV